MTISIIYESVCGRSMCRGSFILSNCKQKLLAVQKASENMVTLSQRFFMNFQNSHSGCSVKTHDPLLSDNFLLHILVLNCLFFLIKKLISHYSRKHAAVAFPNFFTFV